MKSVGSPRRFVYERWVEGPLEGMDRLSRDLNDKKESMQGILGVSAFVLFAFLILLGISLVIDIWSFIQPFIDTSVSFPQNIGYELTGTIMTGIFIALAFIAGLLALQVLSFLATAIKRFENVDELFSSVDPNVAKNIEEIKSEPEIKNFNLFGASSTFTRGIARNMPQASRQTFFIRIIFFMIPLYFWARMLVLPWLFDMDISLFSGLLESVYQIFIILLSIMAIAAGIMIVEADRFMQVVFARMKFLDKIKDAAPPIIGADGSASERLVRFLKDSDDCYGSAVATEDYFIIRHTSDECIVLATATKSPPTKEMVKRFLDDSRSFVDDQSFVPDKGRFMILFTPGGGDDSISDEVTEYILKNPIVLGQGPGDAYSETVIQIVIEEGGAYGLFPFVE